jgi:hypothetical protein
MDNWIDRLAATLAGHRPVLRVENGLLLPWWWPTAAETAEDAAPAQEVQEPAPAPKFEWRETHSPKPSRLDLVKELIARIRQQAR